MIYKFRKSDHKQKMASETICLSLREGIIIWRVYIHLNVKTFTGILYMRLYAGLGSRGLFTDPELRTPSETFYVVAIRKYVFPFFTIYY